MGEVLLGKGIVLLVNGQEIAQIDDVGMPQWTADQIDITHTQSPGGYKEFAAGMKDTGEAPLVINWNPGDPTHQILHELFESGETVECEIPFNDEERTIMKYSAVIVGFAPKAPREGKVMATVTFKASGRATFTTAPVEP